MDPKIIVDSKDCSKNIIDSRNETRLQNLKEDSKVWKQIYNSRFKMKINTSMNTLFLQGNN